jgi:hypothetical protein
MATSFPGPPGSFGLNDEAAGGGTARRAVSPVGCALGMAVLDVEAPLAAVWAGVAWGVGFLAGWPGRGIPT